MSSKALALRILCSNGNLGGGGGEGGVNVIDWGVILRSRGVILRGPVQIGSFACMGFPRVSCGSHVLM